MRQETLKSQKKNSIPSDVYTAEYYLTCCDGHEEFNASYGQQLPRRLSEPLALLNAQPNSFILDIGCGRGELIYQLARRGHRAIGLDYAAYGVDIAQKALKEHSDEKTDKRLALFQSNAKQLPLANNLVDHVFMLDVIEHLFPKEVDFVLNEIYRVLKPGGTLIIHTMPNTWYYTMGYPLYRLVQRLRGVKLPADPRARWEFSDVHVNEQNPLRMYWAMRKSNFKTKIWLASIQDYSYEPNKLVRFGMYFLTKVYPFRIIFCNDIFAVATKPEAAR